VLDEQRPRCLASAAPVEKLRKRMHRAQAMQRRALLGGDSQRGAQIDLAGRACRAIGAEQLAALTPELGDEDALGARRCAQGAVQEVERFAAPTGARCSGSPTASGPYPT